MDWYDLVLPGKGLSVIFEILELSIEEARHVSAFTNFKGGMRGVRANSNILC